MISILTATPAHAASLFGYTHMLPSPLTLPAGRLVYGTDLALGVTDFLQVGTNIVGDLFKVYNANAKVSLVSNPDFAISPTVGWTTYNYKDVSSDNPDLRVTSWLPGLVAAVRVADLLAVFVGGNLNLTSNSLLVGNTTRSGLVHGATVESDLSWAYNPPAKGGRAGNVLSAGATYDLSYRMAGIGVSHHWAGFHLGVHYYPTATRFPVVPIISGGGAVDL